MTALYIAVALPFIIGLYAYIAYPMLLKMVAKVRGPRDVRIRKAEWPLITITVPCYNEANSIASTLESLLRLDYPEERRQIVVISDASTDGTDDIVRTFADRGVDLIRLPHRMGKSAAENAAAQAIRGEIVVNTDATIKIPVHALKELVAAFDDPEVGVASGRDVSVDNTFTIDQNASSGESGYVGYEMGIRSLETQIGSIVGASGCFYGIRASLYDSSFPESLSRDFASALMAREAGYRAVSVEEAVCYVPRTTSLQSEYRRKIRTMARGLQTLWFKKHLLNPITYGSFAWMLISHKVCRWLVYPAFIISGIALLILSINSYAWLAVLLLGVAGLGIGIIGMRWPEHRPKPKLINLAGFVVASNIAGLLAWSHVLQNKRAATWEPTRR